MDRRRRRSATPGAAGLVLAGFAGAVALAAPGDPPIRAMLWVARGADPVRALGSTPTECLKSIADPALKLKVEIGRAKSEKDHGLQGENSGSGVFRNRVWRHAWSGGWFSYQLAVKPDVRHATHA